MPQFLKYSSVFMLGVHELDVSLLFALKLFYKPYPCNNNTKICFFLWILLKLVYHISLPKLK